MTIKPREIVNRLILLLRCTHCTALFGQTSKIAGEKEELTCRRGTCTGRVYSRTNRSAAEGSCRWTNSRICRGRNPAGRWSRTWRSAPPGPAPARRDRPRRPAPLGPSVSSPANPVRRSSPGCRYRHDENPGSSSPMVFGTSIPPASRHWFPADINGPFDTRISPRVNPTSRVLRILRTNRNSSAKAFDCEMRLRGNDNV